MRHSIKINLSLTLLLASLVACGGDEEAASNGGGAKNTSNSTNTTTSATTNTTFNPSTPDLGMTTKPTNTTVTMTSVVMMDMGQVQSDMAAPMPDAGQTTQEMGMMMDMAPAVDMTMVPLEACADPAKWDAAWIPVEQELLKLINEARAKGGTCIVKNKPPVTFPPSAPVKINSALQGVARCHTEHMIQNDYLKARRKDPNNPAADKDGFVSLATFIDKTGYKRKRGLINNVGINVGGIADAQRQFDQWINLSGFCSYILDPQYVDAGIGYSINAAMTEARFVYIGAIPE